MALLNTSFHLDTEEPHRDVATYVQTYSKLLRANALLPLRKAVESLAKGELKGYVYGSVIFHKAGLVNSKTIVPDCETEWRCYRIVFHPFAGVNWVKRLSHGSLVCLLDGSDESIIGVVINRSIHSVSSGEVIVAIVDGRISEDYLKKTYTMVETVGSSVHCLAAAKTLLSLETDTFPFHEFVFGHELNRRPPGYLNTCKPYIVRNSSDEKEFKVDCLLTECSWPSPEQLGLSEDQHSAAFTALCSQLALINGPPGCGKSFLTMFIVKTLIANSSTRDPIPNTPILVLCNSSRTLDQLLDGVSKVTSKIIRVSSDPYPKSLKRFNLSDMRAKAIEEGLANSKTNYYYKARSLLKIKATLDETAEELKAVARKLEAEVPTVEELRIYGVIEEAAASYFSNFPGSKTKKKEGPIRSWLKWNDEFKLIKLGRSQGLKTTDLNAIRECLLQLKTQLRTRPTERENQLANIFAATVIDRWQLFAEWRRCYRHLVRNSLKRIESSYIRCLVEYTEAETQFSAVLCKKSSVIGMTITEAAKNRKLLEAFGAKTVIVEEAGEIPEPFVICALTKDCQHLIMIGDNQFRPDVDVDELKGSYLAVSLFERLISLGFEPSSLLEQKRMRPEIARLITPAIYEKFTYGLNVLNSPNVPGLAENVFFYHHQGEENELEGSYFNQYEVDMALALAAYLVRHGTPQDRITILTGYTAQLSHIEMARRRENWLQNIKVAVVDNYKGEENDVVILSLVRNSKLSSIGFLSNEKRICVALTRAKLGLFVLGDMELFSHERSLWRNVSQTLTQNQTGIAFQVTCPYPKLAGKPEDLSDASSGCQHRWNANDLPKS